MQSEANRIKTFLIPPLELLSNATYQENAWIKKIETDPCCYSEIIEMFSEACEAFLESNFPSALTERQKKMLSKLQKLVESFDWGVGEAEYRNMLLILNNPKWKQIQEKAQALLKDLSHEN